MLKFLFLSLNSGHMGLVFRVCHRVAVLLILVERRLGCFGSMHACMHASYAEGGFRSRDLYVSLTYPCVLVSPDHPCVPSEHLTPLESRKMLPLLLLLLLLLHPFNRKPPCARTCQRKPIYSTSYFPSRSFNVTRPVTKAWQR